MDIVIYGYSDMDIVIIWTKIMCPHHYHYIHYVLYNILANRIVLHIELVNTISPDILPSQESIGSIKQAQILFRAIILKKKFWCAGM